MPRVISRTWHAEKIPLASPPHLQFSKRQYNGLARSMDGGERAAHNAHSQREDNPAHHQVGRNLERKSQMRKSLPVHGPGSEAVQRQHSEAAKGPSDKGDQQGLNQE